MTVASVVVDHEVVLTRLKARLQEKDSWGRRELQSVLVELEAEHQIDVGLLPNTLRLYGVTITHDLLNAGQGPTTEDAAGVSGNGSESQPVP